MFVQEKKQKKTNRKIFFFFLYNLHNDMRQTVNCIGAIDKPSLQIFLNFVE